MGFHMIKGLTAHYKKRGEMWKIDDPSSALVKVVCKPETNREMVVRQLARTTSYRKKLQCTKRVPLSAISFNMVNDVVESWQKIVAIPNWEKVTGDLFLRYIFKVEPATIALFGFPSGTDYLDPNLVSNVTFVTKGVVLIKAIDIANTGT